MSCSVNGAKSWIRKHLKDDNNNDKYRRWDDAYLEETIAIAVRAVFALRPDLFSQEKRIKLDSGCFINICSSGCSRIQEPFYLEGQECEEIDKIDEDAQWFMEFYESDDCDFLNDEASEYKIESIQTYPSAKCKLKITPPVPDDGKVRFLIAECIPTDDAIEEALDNGELPEFVCQNYTAFMELMLYYCYDRDSIINGNSHSEAQDHFNNFFTFINQKLLMDRSIALDDEELLRILQDN